MKYIRIIIVLFTYGMVFTISTVNAYQVINLIPNSGFEIRTSADGVPSGWRFYSNEGATCDWSNSGQRTGGRCVHVSKPYAVGGETIFDNWDEMVPVTQWLNYRAKFAAKGPSLSELIRINDGNPILNTSPSVWDSGTVGKRSIIKDGEYYWMVYEGSTDQPYEQAKWSSGLARSRDLQTWEKWRGTGGPVLPVSNGFGYDGPEWVRTPDGMLNIFFRNNRGEHTTGRAMLVWNANTSSARGRNAPLMDSLLLNARKSQGSRQLSTGHTDKLVLLSTNHGSSHAIPMMSSLPCLGDIRPARN